MGAGGGVSGEMRHGKVKYLAFVIRFYVVLLPLPSVLSILQILSAPPGWQRISEFREASTGQGHLSHTVGFCPSAFLP